MYVGCPNTTYRRPTDLRYMSEVDACYAELQALFAEAVMSSYTVESLEEELFEEKKKDKPTPASKADTEKKDAKETAVNPSFAAKIGRKIKELIAKMKEALKRFVNIFRRSDKELDYWTAEVEKRMKEEPSLKDKVIAASEEGLIDFKDIKSITEFDAEIEKLSQIKDPKTMKEKFESLKQKWDNLDKTKTAKRVAVISSVVTLIAGVVKLAPQLKSLNRTLQEEAHRNNQWAETMYQNFKNEVADRYGDVGGLDDLPRLQVLIAAYQYRAGKIEKAMDMVAEKQGTLANIFKKICETASKSKTVQRKYDHLERSLGRAARNI